MHNPLTPFKDPEIIRVAKQPVEILRILADDKKTDGRAPALILTKEDISRIKRYVQHGLNLPNTLTRLEQELGFTQIGIPGLEPQDLLLTYSAINEHAKSWSGIERDIKATGFDLDLFASQFSNQGRQILDYIDKMEVTQQLDLSVADLSIEIVESLAPAPLTETDKKVCMALADLLTKIAAQIEKHRQSSAQLSNDITRFAHTLTVDLIPGINDKTRLASRADLDDELLELEKEIDRLTADIEEKHQEYRTTRNNVAWGLLGGLVGVIVTDSILSPKAEAIRREKNRLIAEKQAKVEASRQKRPLAAAIFDLQLLLEDMRFRMADAHRGAINLQDIWAMLANYVEQSAKGLAGISDDQALLVFALQFQSVVMPWEEINGITTHLLRIFQNALDEYSNLQNK
ncbi:alpha-xenorhabdolysin family binary toxin subunit A [Pseudomonas viridiflava]|uniref:alpha-xenorhabdolysin family binary toxin subunit A n=1 Tax=Pseudomonas viridiflava TaxID=33069 RepID=UPI0018E5D348|nr:alpha-xenorhabdolysin family binary toxin subunit A [Pseudomonas viridiflava]MBI6681942.1 alpha-xenorhabdolysin family binary toxin subunit A [Pseudomonas viridiflava]